jgi:hypothetical protein
MNAELVRQASAARKMTTFEKVRLRFNLPVVCVCTGSLARELIIVNLVYFVLPDHSTQSQLDWNSLTTSTPTLSTELEANRRTGGYLERQDFLGRVGERKEMRGQGGEDKRRRVG